MRIGNLNVYGIIYKITNKVNGKCYIGQTTIGFAKRYPHKGFPIEKVYKLHNYNKNAGRNYNRYLLKSIIKYGFNNFDVCEIFDIAFSNKELDIKEKMYIGLYNSFNNGYNKDFGGSNSIDPIETRKRISNSHIDVTGENNPRVKITKDTAEEIKIRLSNGEKVFDLMKLFNVSETIVDNIKRLRSWKTLREDLNAKVTQNICKISPKIKQEENRKNIIFLYEQGLNAKEISIKLNNVSFNTILNVIKNYRKNLRRSNC